METLTINIPDNKSTLVKQILKGLGVTIQVKQSTTPTYKEKLLKIPVLSDEDLKSFEDAKKSFNNLKLEQW
ncbi:hypothetical protein [Pedobacter deserti]|uniref:hypothetical protein n=1 Tax=Pedobacter deserti TaxID=2817382 RepID=UPI00210C7F09|nr:hypothetical protein [Pedobacter sp. SYSU D00382]